MREIFINRSELWILLKEVALLYIAWKDKEWILPFEYMHGMYMNQVAYLKDATFHNYSTVYCLF